MIKESNRSDVQIKTSKMIELMSRPQGASSKEVCNELECTKRTFYRLLDRIQGMNIPYFDKSDYDGATNSKRWFITENPISGTNLFLSSSEKIFLRYILEQNKAITKNKEISESILNKINKGILHDVKSSNYQIRSNEYSELPSFDYDKPLKLFTEALENKTPITFTSADFISPFTLEEGVVEISTKQTQEKNFQFEPYSILLRNNSYTKKLCCIGCVRGNSITPSIKCIEISSANNVQKLKGTFTIPKDYSLKKWEDYFFPVVKYKVHLAMDWRTLQDLKDQSWFIDKQCINILDKYHVFLETTDIQHLTRIIVSYGCHIEVISPENLANAVLKRHREARFLDTKPENATQEDEYKIKVQSNNYSINDTSECIWKDALYNLIDNKILDKSVFNFNDSKLNELIKFARTTDDVSKTIFFYKEQLAINYYAFDYVNAIPSDARDVISEEDAQHIVDNWDSYVDEVISKYAPELVSQKTQYKKNGPLFLYMTSKNPEDSLTYAISNKTNVPFFTSRYIYEKRKSLPGRVIKFHQELLTKTTAKITVFKWY